MTYEEHKKIMMQVLDRESKLTETLAFIRDVCNANVDLEHFNVEYKLNPEFLSGDVFSITDDNMFFNVRVKDFIDFQEGNAKALSEFFERTKSVTSVTFTENEPYEINKLLSADGVNAKIIEESDTGYKVYSVMVDDDSKSPLHTGMYYTRDGKTLGYEEYDYDGERYISEVKNTVTHNIKGITPFEVYQYMQHFTIADSAEHFKKMRPEIFEEVRTSDEQKVTTAPEKIDRLNTMISVCKESIQKLEVVIEQAEAEIQALESQTKEQTKQKTENEER